MIRSFEISGQTTESNLLEMEENMQSHGAPNDYFYEETTNIFQECDDLLSRTPVEKTEENQPLTTCEELLKFFVLFNISTRAMQYLLDTC